MKFTVRQVIARISAIVPVDPPKDTVDVIKTGNPDQEVNKIGVAFLLTADLISKAVDQGVDFIITHEPTFYNHLDNTEWLEEDPIYQSKRQLIERHHLCIWRFHDLLHDLPPDSTLLGLAAQLDLTVFSDPASFGLYHIPPMSLQDLHQWVCDRLKNPEARKIGDPRMVCRNIRLLPGAPGGMWQIGALSEPGVDVVITGEINEWETNIYVQDAHYFGVEKGLIVAGHAATEEEGMRRLVPWMQSLFPDTEVVFLEGEE